MDLEFLLQQSHVLALHFLLTLLLMSVAQSSEAPMVLPGCPSKCGRVEVPYPFGIRKGCAKDDTFLFTCNDTHYNPPQLFWGNINITHIDLIGHLDVLFYIKRDCFDEVGNRRNTGDMSTDLTGSPFTISADRNWFTVIGCDTLAYLVNVSSGFATGCASLCNSLSAVDNNTCSGIGCCQTSIPKRLKYYQPKFSSYFNHTRVYTFNPCSLAFVVDRTKFVFHTSLLTTDHTDLPGKLPAMLDWAIEGENCQKAKQNLTYACRSNNSYCFPSPNELGYLCNCSSGYQGNPYLDDGCKDINECGSPENCQGICINTPGSYNCSCQSGYHSDDPKTQKCMQYPTGQKVAWWFKLFIGLGGSLFFLAFVACIVYLGIQKRKLHNLNRNSLSRMEACFCSNKYLLIINQVSGYSARKN